MMQRKVNKPSTRFWYYHHPLCQPTALWFHSSVKTGIILAELVLSRSVLGTGLCDYISDTVQGKQEAGLCLWAKFSSVICPAGTADIPSETAHACTWEDFELARITEINSKRLHCNQDMS